MNALVQLPDQGQLVALALYSASAHPLDAFLKRWGEPSLALRRSTPICQRVQAATGAAATQPEHHQPICKEGQGTRLDMPEPGDTGAEQQRERKSYKRHMVEQKQSERCTRCQQQSDQQALPYPVGWLPNSNGARQPCCQQHIQFGLPHRCQCL